MSGTVTYTKQVRSDKRSELFKSQLPSSLLQRSYLLVRLYQDVTQSLITCAGGGGRRRASSPRPPLSGGGRGSVQVGGWLSSPCGVAGGGPPAPRSRRQPQGPGEGASEGSGQLLLAVPLVLLGTFQEALGHQQEMINGTKRRINES